MKKNRILSNKMIAYWSSFAGNGSPDVKGLPEWPQFDPADSKYILLDEEVKVESDFRVKQCEILDSVIY